MHWLVMVSRFKLALIAIVMLSLGMSSVGRPRRQRLLKAPQPVIEQPEQIAQVTLAPATTADLNTSARALSYHVRVLLAKYDQVRDAQIVIRNDQGFILIDPEDANTKSTITAPTLTIYVRDGHLIVNSKKYRKHELYITARSTGTLRWQDRSYRGSFLIVLKDNQLYVINSVDLEDYVCCVLRTESWPGWPVEVNKVLAIACRSYAIGVIAAQKHKKPLYHVKNTNHHQTYAGIHTDPILQQAVNETKGVFIAYNNRPIIAMFDACCGGIVPADMQGIDFDKEPYLARPYACMYCKECKIFNWQARWTAQELEGLLHEVLPALKNLKECKISKRDKAGIIHELAVRGNRPFHLTGKQLYSQCKKKIKSFSFTITKQANAFIFKGKGYGHHLGLCQWGAREMVRQGYSCRGILQFYYPQTTFMRLS